MFFYAMLFVFVATLVLQVHDRMYPGRSVRFLRRVFRAVRPRKVPAQVMIAIVKTADWWVQTLREPIFSNGEPRLAAHWADVQANHRPPSEEALETFKILLVEHLLQLYMRDGNFGELGLRLRVDYDVDGILAELGDKAGIPSYNTWPVKTGTHIMANARKGCARGWMAGERTMMFAY